MDTTKLNIDAFNKVQTSLGTGKQFAVNQGVVPVLSSDVLAGSGTPMNISPAQTGTSPTGLGAEITSLSNAGVAEQDKQDTLLAQQTADASKAKTATDTSQSDILARMGLVKGETALTDQAYSTKNDLGTTVDETGKKLRDINAKINAVDIATNEELKQLNATFKGTVGGKNIAMQGIQTKASSAKADLYIDKLMAQGDYDSAKSIADRKVSMIMEQDKIDLEKLKFDYLENKALFTTAEQRKFDLMVSDRESAIKIREERLKAAETAKIEAAKPDNQVVQLDNGNTVVINKKTGAIVAQVGGSKTLPGDTIIDPVTGKPTSELKINARTSAQALLDKVKSGAGMSAVGLSRLTGAQYVPGTPQADLIVQFDNLKSLLSLDNIKLLKGQGQVSDAERKLLSDASAKISLTQSEKEFKNALTDVYIGLGGQQEVTLTDSKGNSQKVIIDAAGLQKAKDDGIKITY